MKNEKIPSKIEVFICHHHREDAENCLAKGSKPITDELKKWAKEEMNKEIKVFRSGCLGKCSEGIAMACFPQKNYLLDVKSDDLVEIKKGLKEALIKLKN